MKTYRELQYRIKCIETHDGETRYKPEVKRFGIWGGIPNEWCGDYYCELRDCEMEALADINKHKKNRASAYTKKITFWNDPQ